VTIYAYIQLTSAIVVWRHTANIKRLLNHTESKVFNKKKQN
jgi:glycerol-3-phosphate acyltransferase PlsY